MLVRNPRVSVLQLHLSAQTLRHWSDNSEPSGSAKHRRKLCRPGRLVGRPAFCASAEVDRTAADHNQFRRRNLASFFPRETFSLSAPRLASPDELAAVLSAPSDQYH